MSEAPKEIIITEKEAGDMDQYVKDSQELIQKQAGEIKDLEAQLLTQKEASEGQAGVQAPVLDEARVRSTLDKLASARIAKQDEVGAMLNNTMEDPNVLLSYLDKIAEQSMQPVAPMGKPSGSSVVNSSETRRESDVLWDSKFGG